MYVVLITRINQIDHNEFFMYLIFLKKNPSADFPPPHGNIYMCVPHFGVESLLNFDIFDQIMIFHFIQD